MQITELPDAMGLNYNKYKHRASAGVTAIGPAVRKKMTHMEKNKRDLPCVHASLGEKLWVDSLLLPSFLQKTLQFY